MIKFEEILRKVNGNSKLQKDLFYSENNSQHFFYLVKKYANEHPENISSNEFSNYISNIIKEASEILLTSPSYRSNTLQINTMQYLLDNPNEIDSIYYEILDDEKTSNTSFNDSHITYSSNPAISKKMAINQILYSHRVEQVEFKDFIKTYKLKSQKEKALYLKKIPSKMKKQFLALLDDNINGNELDQIKCSLQHSLPELKSNFKNNLINSLVTMGEFFEKIDVLKDYINIQNKIFSSLNISKLCFSSISNNSDNPELSIKNIFDKTILEKLDYLQLYALNAFWLNRLAKEIENINSSYFIVNSLDLWKSILDANIDSKNDYINLKIDEKALSTLYKKAAFLKIISDRVSNKVIHGDYEQYKNDENPYEISDKYKSKVIQYDLGDVIKDISIQIGDKYTQEFKKDLPQLEHSFMDDYQAFYSLNEIKFNTYYRKDCCIIGIIDTLNRASFPLNYGIMLETNKDFLQEKRVLLGIDIHGLNMPLRLHVDKSLIQDYMQESTGKLLFPLYEGNNDFRILGNNIGTHILSPISRNYKQIIKSYLSLPNIHQKKNFLEHLLFIADKKSYPEHLKKDKIITENKKTRISKARPLQRFINLSNGDIYAQPKKGEFILSTNNNKEKE